MSAGGDEDAIKDVVTNFFKGFSKDPGIDYSTKFTVGDEMRFVRPTGNPIGMLGFKAMFQSEAMGDDATNDVWDWNKIHVGTDSALCCVTHHATFTYEGTPNEDVAVSSFYLTKAEGDWKILWAQRSTGRPPTDAKPEGF